MRHGACIGPGHDDDRNRHCQPDSNWLAPGHQEVLEDRRRHCRRRRACWNRSAGPEPRSGQERPAFRFETTTADRGPIRAKVTATGTVNPIVTVQVGAQVSGTIQALGADFNSVVKPGQMMAQIDPRLFKAAVQQAEANFLSAKANVLQVRTQLANARKQAKRNQNLLAEKFVAQQDVDTTDTAAAALAAQLKSAEAAAAQSEAALATTRTNLAYTTIRSPVSGTVITRNIDVGQTVAAAFAAPTLFLVGEDLTKMQVDTNIAEADVGRLAPGMTATFTVDAYPAEVFTGKIREVRNSPQVIQNVVTYDAVVDVDNSARKLKPGMTANIEVSTPNGRRLACRERRLRFRPPESLGVEPPRFPSIARWSGPAAGRRPPSSSSQG